MIEDVKKYVYEVLCKDDSGHGYDHVERGYKLAIRFARKEKAGREEASNRHQLMVDFLYELFEEEEAYEWKEYLDKYLENL